MFTEDNYIMWLSRIEGLSLKKKTMLLNYFKTASEIWKSAEKLKKLFNNLSEVNINNIIKAKDEFLLNKYLKELEEKNIKFISINNKNYPSLLSKIQNPPIGIYLAGNIPDNNKIKVSIVGSRRCTEYGASSAYKFSKQLAENDIIVVSGMAIGIDTIAHNGCLDGNGFTIAVLGCGVDICYPSSNKELMNKIISKGCIISEYPPGTRAFPANFPQRNRIISGLSNATVIVEAAKKSGTLITATEALEQGRDVFAVPGNINSKLSQGTNNLIKEGAYPLTEIEDIFNVLNIDYNGKKNENIKKILDTLAKDEKLVYDCIGLEPISIDKLSLKTNLSVQSVQYLITMLEIRGYIQRLSGQRYIRSL